MLIVPVTGKRTGKYFMSKEYKCLQCVHLKPSYDLMECELQVTRSISPTSWVYDAVCIFDAEAASRKWRLEHEQGKDVSNYETENGLTNRFKAK